MKKIYNILMAAAIALGTFTSCEDVPMPFNNPLDYLEPDPEEVVIEPAGDGTKDSPFNVAAVLNYINTLEADVKSDKDVYITGVVTSIKETFGTQYGNATFNISDNDEGSNTFTCYQIYYFNNAKYTAKNEANNDLNINEGDVVVVYGKVLNFRGSTPETQAREAYIISINGKSVESTTPSAGDPKGTGTEADPFNVAAAVAKCKEVGQTASTDKYYVKGIADDDYTVNSYKNIEVNIVDKEGSSEKFKVFRCKGVDGKDIKEGYKVSKGDVIIVYGPVVNYMGNTPETATGAYVVSVNGKAPEGTGGGSDTPSSNLGTKDAPLTVAKALDTINAMEDSGETETEAFVKGKISKVQSYNDKYKSITYYISDDGTETKELQIYSGKNIGGAEFASIEDLSVGDVVVVKGKLKKFMKNGEVIPEMNQPNEIVTITKASGGGEQGGGEQGVEGSYSKPYSVASGISAQGAEFNNVKNIYVKGYIVGWVEGQVLADGAHFNANATVKTNILIADTANETDLSKCMPVQLPNNDVRSGMNLQEHPEFYGKAVILYGELAKYFGAAGVKTVTYAESDGKTFGTKP